MTSFEDWPTVHVVVRVNGGPARRARESAWRDSRSPRWRSCSWMSPSRSGKCRAESGRPSCRPQPRGRRDERRGRSSESSSPSPAFTSAAMALMSPRERMKTRGNRMPLTGKFRTARRVCAPYSASTGTLISPRESFSMRKSGIEYLASDRQDNRTTRIWCLLYLLR